MRHGNDYAESIAKVKGVKVAEPLTQTGKNTNDLAAVHGLRTIFSMGGDGGPGTLRNASVQKED